MTGSSAFCSVSKAAFRATQTNLYNLKTFFIYFSSLILFQSHMYNYEKNNTQFFFLWEDYLVFFIILLLPVFFFTYIYLFIYPLLLLRISFCGLLLQVFFTVGVVDLPLWVLVECLIRLLWLISAAAVFSWLSLTILLNYGMGDLLLFLPIPEKFPFMTSSAVPFFRCSFLFVAAVGSAWVTT